MIAVDAILFVISFLQNTKTANKAVALVAASEGFGQPQRVLTNGHDSFRVVSARISCRVLDPQALNFTVAQVATIKAL